MRLHPQHGVNPTTYQCFYCGESMGLLLIGAHSKQFKDAGLAMHDGEMRRQIGVISMEPCDKCKEYMQQGVLLISVKDETNEKNPYRTGGWVVVKDHAIRKMVQPEALQEHILKARFAFVPDQAWDALGLPRAQ